MSVPVVEELVDGQVLDVAGGLRVLHTPGHTPGHVSLLHEASGVLITGDAIFNMASRMRWPMAAVCTSARQNQQSAHVLGELEYRRGGVHPRTGDPGRRTGGDPRLPGPEGLTGA